MKSLIKDATILITGANGGIGIETVKILIERGARQIILGCRTKEKAEEVKHLLGNHDVLTPAGGFDMQNRENIRKAVDKLSDTKIDILFFQAGGMIVSEDFQHVIVSNSLQIEKTIYQNVIGAFITLEALRTSNRISDKARIVFAGGEGARGIKGMIKKPEYDSSEQFMLAVTKGIGKYSDIDSLGVSKFMTALLVQELAKRDEKHEYVWFSPGLTAGTNGLQNVSPFKRFMFENIGFPMMELLGMAQNPKNAANKYADCLDGKYGT